MRKTLLALALSAFVLAAHASRVLTDETGRKVTLPDHPHRIVCLVPSVTDTVFALGSGDDVVAISDYTVYPPAALKKPSIGGLVKPSIETILAFHPDLVVGTQIPGSAETATQLETVGIPVFLIDPHGLAGILHSVDSIGRALNRLPQAAALNSSLTQRIEAVNGLVRPDHHHRQARVYHGHHRGRRRQIRHRRSAP
jgi:ABC-type Fe3+-hydroxamate transport system substrate-binding protein